MEQLDFIAIVERSRLMHQKIHALKNFSETLDNFEEWGALELAGHYFKQGSSDPEIEVFLDYILKKYHVDYVDWYIKSPWVKSQASVKAKERKQIHIMFEDLEEMRLNEWRKTPIPSFLQRHTYHIFEGRQHG